MPVNLLLLKRAMVGLRVRLPGACRTAFSLLPSLLREGFVIRLRGCGPCFLVVICTLMWFGSRVWLLLSCGSVFAPVSCLLGRVGSGRVLLVSVVGCLRRVSRSFSRGFGGMSSRTFVSICLSGHNVDCHIGLAQHNVRQGWRAWVFQRWLGSGRHELLRLPQLSADSFRALDITNVRNWILSAAPAASVGLGATFSPGHWSVLSHAGDQSPSCVWGCGEVGFWDHICWSCPCRPSSAPCRPRCPLLARFGWVGKDTNLPSEEVDGIRGWLSSCQLRIWDTKVVPSPSNAAV